MKKLRPILTVAIIAGIVGLLCAATMLTAYTDYRYICENTGSQKGHREWFFGLETKH